MSYLLRAAFAAIVFLLSSTSVTTHAASLWFGDEDYLRRFDPVTLQITLRLTLNDLGDTQALAPDAEDNSLWLLTDERLLKYDAAGAVALRLSYSQLGMGDDDDDGAGLLLDPYDRSIWLVSGSTLLHLDNRGNRLSKTALPAPARAAALALSERVWVLGDRVLWQYSAQGALLARHDLRQLMQDEPKRLAIDSISGKIWLAGDKQLLQFTPAYSGPLRQDNNTSSLRG